MEKIFCTCDENQRAICSTYSRSRPPMSCLWNDFKNISQFLILQKMSLLTITTLVISSLSQFPYCQFVCQCEYQNISGDILILTGQTQGGRKFRIHRALTSIEWFENICMSWCLVYKTTKVHSLHLNSLLEDTGSRTSHVFIKMVSSGVNCK